MCCYWPPLSLSKIHRIHTANLREGKGRKNSIQQTKRLAITRNCWKNPIKLFWLISSTHLISDVHKSKYNTSDDIQNFPLDKRAKYCCENYFHTRVFLLTKYFVSHSVVVFVMAHNDTSGWHNKQILMRWDRTDEVPIYTFCQISMQFVNWLVFSKLPYTLIFLLLFWDS